MTKKTRYRSGAEEQFAKVLKKNKLKFKYEPFALGYQVILDKNYRPDFVFKNAVIIEFKGYFDATDRKKLLAVRRDNPLFDLRIVFQQDNWMTKAHKRRYSDWAKENEFKYHVGISLPKEWIEELQ